MCETGSMCARLGSRAHSKGDERGGFGVGTSMVGRGTAEEKLAYLRELILNARAMPMSASCVINRSEVLAAIDDVIDNLPDEIADAQQVIDTSASKVAEGEAEAGRILAEAREHAASLAQHSEVVRVAEQVAAQMRSEADQEAAACAGRSMSSSTRVWRALSPCCTRRRARCGPLAPGWRSAAAWIRASYRGWTSAHSRNSA